MSAPGGSPVGGQQRAGGAAPVAKDGADVPGPDPSWAEAQAYLGLYHREHDLHDRLPARLDEVRREIERTGTYRQTAEEVLHGAKVAWRNSNKCIGRLYWNSLRLRDMRHLAAEEEVFEACVDHLRVAYHGGKIRPTITVFAPQEPGGAGIRIWNPQLIRYAGYRQADGSVIGDPSTAELTEALRALGWPGGAGTPFDVLPLAIQMPGRPPRVFDLPADAVVEVPIRHPDFAWFAELGLRWHAVPAISGMLLDLGGVRYTAAPFNGWYMGTEIGARNFGDAARYNLLPLVARKMGLNTRSERSLWIDRALLEVNVAVIHSFAAAKVTLIDHHIAAQHFMQHIEHERQAGRAVTGQWSWLVPPMSGSTTPVYHRGYKNTILKPNYFYQPDPWKASPPRPSPAVAAPDPSALP
jgi:nitric-oxide synthase, bacterial